MFESLLSVLKMYDDTLPPGPQELVQGDRFFGYYGDFKDGLPGPDSLANLVGLTAGATVGTDHSWLKIVENGKLIYIAKRTVRNNVRWQQLEDLSLISGRRIRIGRHEYILRVMTGFTGTAIGGEWNRWIYPFHTNRPANYSPVFENFTNAQMGIGSVLGGANWTPEEALANKLYHRSRGYNGVTTSTDEVSGSTIANYGWRPILEWIDPDAPPLDSGPGPTTLAFGNDDAGYYGRVDTSLIGSNIDVSLACGMDSTGVLIADTPNWLKFIYRNRVMYIPQKPLRHTMRWLDLKNAGVTDVGKEIVLNGYKYRVRLMLVATKDSGNANGNATGREWRDLLYNTTAASTAKWDTFTNTDLMVASQSTGSYTWGQETGTSTGGAGRVGAGYQDMTQLHVNTEINAAAVHMAWRPVLDLIGKA